MSVAKAYRTNLADVPLAQGLKKDDGWIDMQVQFLIDEKTAGAETSVVGWTVLKPGAAHERHLHRNCDEFFIVIKGSGHLYVEDREEAAKEGDVVYSSARLQEHIGRRRGVGLGLERIGLAGGQWL